MTKSVSLILDVHVVFFQQDKIEPAKPVLNKLRGLFSFVDLECPDSQVYSLGTMVSRANHVTAVAQRCDAELSRTQFLIDRFGHPDSVEDFCAEMGPYKGSEFSIHLSCFFCRYSK